MRFLPAAACCLPALFASAVPAQDSTTRPPPVDCWVEHSQVQPSRTAEGAPDPKTRLAGDRHAGAEHLPRIARLPPCSAEAPRAGVPATRTGAAADAAPATLTRP